MNKRRTFLKKSALSALAATMPISLIKANNIIKTTSNVKVPKISLAQWSLHNGITNKQIDPVNFAKIAKNEFNISAIEYVNQFYVEHAKQEKFWFEMRKRAENEGVESLLIMVDNEGDLGDPDKTKRKKAVKNHYKWVNAAKIMGCHSIRVNAFGKGENQVLKENLISGLGDLAAYGKKTGIHVLIENHGLHSSDALFIVDIIKKVDNPYLGTLPDFGNWCLNMEWGSTKNDQCSNIFDPAKGVAEFLPYAKGVSAKTYDFDDFGNATIIDYKKLLQLVKDANFDGAIGIEYEGEILSEYEGIRASKKLIESTWASLD